MVAQQISGSAVAPVPPAIFSAKKIFISNAGADSGLFPQPFTGSPDRAYNRFLRSGLQLGNLRLVDDPAEADLILELQLFALMVLATQTNSMVPLIRCPCFA